MSQFNENEIKKIREHFDAIMEIVKDKYIEERVPLYLSMNCQVYEAGQPGCEWVTRPALLCASITGDKDSAGDYQRIFTNQAPFSPENNKFIM